MVKILNVVNNKDTYDVKKDSIVKDRFINLIDKICEKTNNSIEVQ